MIHERDVGVTTGHLHAGRSRVGVGQMAEAGPILRCRQRRVVESLALSRNEEGPAIPRLHCVAAGEEVEEEGERASGRRRGQVLVPAVCGGDKACESLALRITWAVEPAHEVPVFREG
jgi:hypothetical protein